MSEPKNQFDLSRAQIGNLMTGDRPNATAHLNIGPSGSRPAPDVSQPVYPPPGHRSVPVPAAEHDFRADASVSKLSVGIAGSLSASSVLGGVYALVQGSQSAAEIQIFDVYLQTSSIGVVLMTLGIVGFGVTVATVLKHGGGRSSRKGT